MFGLTKKLILIFITIIIFYACMKPYYDRHIDLSDEQFDLFHSYKIGDSLCFVYLTDTLADTLNYVVSDKSFDYEGANTTGYMVGKILLNQGSLKIFSDSIIDINFSDNFYYKFNIETYTFYDNYQDADTSYTNIYRLISSPSDTIIWSKNKGVLNIKFNNGNILKKIY